MALVYSWGSTKMSTDVAYYTLYNHYITYIAGMGLSIHRVVVFVGVVLYRMGCYCENGLLYRVVVFIELICSQVYCNVPGKMNII